MTKLILGSYVVDGGNRREQTLGAQFLWVRDCANHVASVGDKKTGQMRRDGEQVEDRCRPDYAVAVGFGPKIKFSRTRSLMEGGKKCNPGWEWEECVR